MEPFYHQSWFWAGCFTAIASLGGILIKEWITSRSQIRVERLKIYESDVLAAHKKLYRFISIAYSWLWPPNEPKREFRDLMKNEYFKEIKENMLFYSQNIRRILETFESQYICMGDPDLRPEKPFDEFYDDDLLDFLNELAKSIQQKTDKILHISQ